MADKTRPTIPVVPTFVDGEAPTAGKLNVLGAVLKHLALTTELYFGDIWGESWPYSVLTTTRLTLPYGRKEDSDAVVTLGVDRFLDQANIARLIGPASNLNPYFLEDTTIVDEVPSGGNEFTLTYIPNGTVVFSSIGFSNPVSAHEDIAATGDYFVSDKGVVYTYGSLPGGTATYDISPETWASGENYTGARFNVIPDPAQCENGVGLTIGGVEGDNSRTLTLPVVSHYISSRDGQNAATNTSDAVNGVQLRLPRVITDNFAVGEILPRGFLYVKNWSTGEIYYTANYYYVSETQVNIKDVDLSDEVSAGDVLYVITVGTDITTSIADLKQKSRHSHDRTYGEKPVSVYELVDVFRDIGGNNGHVLSEIPGNYFPQYLHRNGYTAGGGVDATLNDNNIMRGHLALGIDGLGTAGAHGSTDGNSYKIMFFGQEQTQRPFMRQEDSALVLNAVSATPEKQANPSADEVAGKFGVRVKDSHFVPEYGIIAGLSENENSVIPVGINYSYDTDGGLLFLIDLDTDYGVDPVVYRILSADIYILPNGDTRYYARNDTATLSTEIYFADTNIITINLTGSSYGFGQIIGIRGVVWISRK